MATRKRDIQDFSGFTYSDEDKVAKLAVTTANSTTLLSKAHMCASLSLLLYPFPIHPKGLRLACANGRRWSSSGTASA